MFLQRKRSNWTKAGDICASKRFQAAAGLDRLALLDAVWKKEIGRLGEHCALLGIDRAVLLVKPSSAAAANELALRSATIVKGLNKYFKRPWIKGIRPATKI